ncbi:hypothetical protein [Pseudarthrobacter sp. NPDC080039]|uniref:hypothetical protein n=1 Tax=unclassified Pseudarthrobacter TaxID=2647000 RepID=UPI00344D3F6B
MADMSKFLDLVSEYQSAKRNEGVIGWEHLPNEAESIAAKALEELKALLGE